LEITRVTDLVTAYKKSNNPAQLGESSEDSSADYDLPNKPLATLTPAYLLFKGKITKNQPMTANKAEEAYVLCAKNINIKDLKVFFDGDVGKPAYVYGDRNLTRQNMRWFSIQPQYTLATASSSVGYMAAPTLSGFKTLSKSMCPLRRSG
jgi:hypothetical protein